MNRNKNIGFKQKRFESAMSLVGHEFMDRIRYYALVWWPARSIVHQAIEKRFEVIKTRFRLNSFKLNKKRSN